MAAGGDSAGESGASAWIAGARAGDAVSRDELCRYLAPRLAAWVERHMGARARRWCEPADIVQRALVETIGALDSLPPGAGEEEILKRLYTVANSRIRDSIRNHGRDAGESILDEFARDDRLQRSATGSVTRDDARKWVRDLVGELPPELAEAVRLCALEGLSFVAAGQRLGLQPDAVRKRYDRAREMLVRRLGADGRR